MAITIKNLHKDLPEDQLHEAKGFTTASNNTYLKKNQDGSSEWLAEYWLEPVLGVVTGASAPPTESTGHRYILTGSSFDAGWDSPAQHEIVEFDGTSWVGIAAVDGMRVVDLSDDSVYYFNTAWNQVTDANTDTTYTISAVDSGDDAIIRLTAGGSGSGDDDITLVAGTGMTITPSGDNITLASTGGTDTNLSTTDLTQSVTVRKYDIDDYALVFEKVSGTDFLRLDANNEVLTSSAQYNSFTGQAYSDLHTLTDGATITPDWINGNVQTVELGGNRIIANPTSIKAGATYILILKQDSTGSRTVTWGTNYKFSGGTAPTLTTTGGQADVITLVAYSTSILMCTSVLNFATS